MLRWRHKPIVPVPWNVWEFWNQLYASRDGKILVQPFLHCGAHTVPKIYTYLNKHCIKQPIMCSVFILNPLKYPLNETTYFTHALLQTHDFMKQIDKIIDRFSPVKVNFEVVCICLQPLKGASSCFACTLVISEAEETLLKRINLAGTPETLQGKQLFLFCQYGN